MDLDKEFEDPIVVALTALISDDEDEEDMSISEGDADLYCKLVSTPFHIQTIKKLNGKAPPAIITDE